MECARLAVDRRVPAAPAICRDLIRTTLRSLGYRIAASGPGIVDALRGGRVRSALRATDLALRTTATVVGTSRSSALLIITEPVSTTGMNSSPAVRAQEILDMAAVQQALDDSLLTLGTSTPTLPVLLTPRREVTTYSALVAQLHRGGHEAPRAKLLGAGPALPYHGVATITWSGGALPVTGHRLQQLLSTAAYIGGHGDVLPSCEHEALVDLTRALWVIAQGAQPGIRAHDSLGPIAELVERQTRTRLALADRRLLRCRDCHFDKVVNPQYARLARRNVRLRNAIGVGAAAIMPSATAATVGARAAMALSFEPDFVCPRCQGLEPDELRACICPQCGQLRKEVVLRHCLNDKCRCDLAAVLGEPRPFIPVRTS